MKAKTGVLLIHGFTGSPKTFEHFIEYAKKRHPENLYLAPVIAGHGTSPEDLEKTTTAQWVESIELAYAELAKQCEGIIVVGASLGAALAIHLAQHKLVKAIVLIGYPRTVYRQPLLSVAARCFILFGIHFYKKSSKYLEDEASIFNQGGKKYELIPAVSTLRLFSFAKKETDHLLPKVTAPTLIIQSNKDGLVKPSSAHYVYKNIGSQIKLLTWVHEPHHRLHLGKSRDQIYTLIEDFINKYAQ